MISDHRRILATGLGRLRGKLKYRPVIFELMPEAFTLSALQRTVEAIAGVALHKQNFRRVVERTDLVEGLGRMDAETGGRPAELFRFRRELLAARPALGPVAAAAAGLNRLRRRNYPRTRPVRSGRENGTPHESLENAEDPGGGAVGAADRRRPRRRLPQGHERGEQRGRHRAHPVERRDPGRTVARRWTARSVGARRWLAVLVDTRRCLRRSHAGRLSHPATQSCLGPDVRRDERGLGR